jgi:hypothetical protein
MFGKCPSDFMGHEYTNTQGEIGRNLCMEIRMKQARKRERVLTRINNLKTRLQRRIRRKRDGVNEFERMWPEGKEGFGHVLWSQCENATCFL